MHASYEHKQIYILLAVLYLLPRVCASIDSGLTSRILCGGTVPELHSLGRLNKVNNVGSQIHVPKD